MPTSYPRRIKKEKVARGGNINLGSAFTLRGQHGPTELIRIDLQQKKLQRQDILEVDYTYEDDPKALAERAENLKKVTSSGKRKQLSMILMKLCNKLVLGLPRKNLVFDVAKGRIYSKRSNNRLLVSVKDPFIKELNYGR